MTEFIVLIIDDEEGIRESLTGIFEDEGYTVLTASSGEDALNILKEQSADLILLDVWLPGIDGIQTLKDIDFRFDENWHTLEIKGYNNILNVYLDDELLVKHKDTENPFLSGMPGFEIHTGGAPITPDYLIDDVEIKVITEEDIIYP